MVIIKRLAVLFFVFVLLVTEICSACFAEGFSAIQTLEQINLPQGMNITVSDVCSNHAYFMQAAANDRGDFAIYTRHINPEDYSDFDFSKVYIDLYQYDTKFVCEISFTTQQDIVMEMVENAIHIYFYDYMIVYNLKAEEVACYSIPVGTVVSGETSADLRKETFLAGDWTYSCQRAVDGYTKLTRTNGEQEQILVEMPGTGAFWGENILIGGGVGMVLTMIIVLYKRKMRKTRKAKD